MATDHLNGTHDTDFYSLDNCQRWISMDNLEGDEEYRLARAKVIFAARDRIEILLGYKLSLMEQVYVRDIAFEVVPWAMNQRVTFPKVRNIQTIHPIRETVARYMRDVLRISIEELMELNRVFGKDRVKRALNNHHEAIHRP